MTTQKVACPDCGNVFELPRSASGSDDDMTISELGEIASEVALLLVQRCKSNAAKELALSMTQTVLARLHTIRAAKELPHIGEDLEGKP